MDLAKQGFFELVAMYDSEDGQRLHLYFIQNPKPKHQNFYVFHLDTYESIEGFDERILEKKLARNHVQSSLQFVNPKPIPPQVKLSGEKERY